MGTIELEGMEFFAKHGHFEAERISGNKFTVDLTIKTNLTKAAHSDKLKDTINYQEVYDIVKKEMEITSFLLENVSQRIIDKLYEHFKSIEKISIKVSKINPQMGGQINKVSVCLTK